MQDYEKYQIGDITAPEILAQFENELLGNCITAAESTGVKFPDGYIPSLDTLRFIDKGFAPQIVALGGLYKQRLRVLSPENKQFAGARLSEILEVNSSSPNRIYSKMHYYKSIESATAAYDKAKQIGSQSKISSGTLSMELYENIGGDPGFYSSYILVLSAYSPTDEGHSLDLMDLFIKLPNDEGTDHFPDTRADRFRMRNKQIKIDVFRSE